MDKEQIRKNREEKLRETSNRRENPFRGFWEITVFNGGTPRRGGHRKKKMHGEQILGGERGHVLKN